MNILIVAPDFKPNLGGIAEYTHQLAIALGTQGHAVTVLRLEPDSRFRSSPPQAYRLVEYRPSRYLRRPTSDTRRLMMVLRAPARILEAVRWRYRLYRQITTIVRQEAIDVILLNFLHLPVGTIVRLAARRVRVPWCLLAHGKEIRVPVRGRSDPGRIGKKHVRRLRLLRSADLIGCVSAFTRTAVMEAGVNERETILLAPGVIVPALENAADREGRFSSNLVVTVARLIERKGIDRAIEAMPLVLRRRPDTTYLVIGDGPDRSRLEGMVSPNLAGHILFAGRIPHEEKVALLRRAAVMVMPNRELPDGDVEGFGIVFLEANAYGVPVVGGRSGGATDAIVDGVTGYLVDPDRPEEIAESIVKILDDEACAARMRVDAREHARRFTWERTAKQLEARLRGLLIRNQRE